MKYFHRVRSLGPKRRLRTYQNAGPKIDCSRSEVLVKDNQKNSEADRNEGNANNSVTLSSNKKVNNGNEIDELFSSFRNAKREKNEMQEISNKKNADQERKRLIAMKNKKKENRIINPEAPVHRIDQSSGLPVYKAHLLKVGDGGGTPLCPFDCNCCF